MHCLITGGTRGIGAAIAALMAKAGYGVSLVGLDLAEGLKAAAQIKAKGGNAVALQGDACQYEDVVRVFDEAEHSLGPLCDVVNAVGMLDLSRFEDQDLEKLSQLTTVNVIAFLVCSLEASRRMAVSRGGQGGTIINITTSVGLGGKGHHAIDLDSAKTPVDVFTIEFARRAADEGIRIANVRQALCTALNTSSLVDARVMVDDSLRFNHLQQSERIAQTVLAFVTNKPNFTEDDETAAYNGNPH